MKCWHGEGSFADLLWSDSRVNRYLSRDELDKLFDIDYYFKAIDEIFLRFSE
jgi:adenylosuccinate lyase